MSIPFSRYVNIVSGVGGGNNVRQRDLIARLFTSSPMIGPDTVMEFSRDNLTAVATLFGSSSDEYKMASSYFSYVSPNTTMPQYIAFASNRPTSVGAAVYGNTDFKDLANLQGITTGDMNVSVGGVLTAVSGLNFSSDASLADVATTLASALVSAGLTGASVSYMGGRFIVQLPDFATIAITQASTGAQDAATALGLTLAVGAINVTGSEAVTPLEALQASEAISDNFGSILWVQPISLTDAKAVSEYVQTVNVKYQAHYPVAAATAADWAAGLADYSGTGLTLSPATGEWPEIIPCAILAATRYDRRNSVQNYMFKQLSGITPSVRSGADADTYDAIRVNYYGDTSTGGQQIKFYQRGTLMGLATSPVDMNTYANEQWLKDYAGSQIMSLLLSVSRVPANAQGIGMISNILQPVIDQALYNGTISTGKTLTSTQRIYLTQATGDENAYLVIQSQGYILQVSMESYTTVSGATEWKCVYQLWYSKDDAVRRVDGTHTLI